MFTSWKREPEWTSAHLLFPQCEYLGWIFAILLTYQAHWQRVLLPKALHSFAQNLSWLFWQPLRKPPLKLCSYLMTRVLSRASRYCQADCTRALRYPHRLWVSRRQGFVLPKKWSQLNEDLLEQTLKEHLSQTLALRNQDLSLELVVQNATIKAFPLPSHFSYPGWSWIWQVLDLQGRWIWVGLCNRRQQTSLGLV